jgi:SAM-dependent methyltransferase
MSWFALERKRDATPEARYRLGVSSNLFAEPLPEGIYYPDFTTHIDYRPPEFIGLFDAAKSKPWSKCTILDIGCGEGTSSVALGRTGARVIGIEGRPEVVRRAEYLRDRLGYTNVEFRTGSVLDPSVWEQADAAFVSGLIHHLAEPFQLIELLGKHVAEMAYFCTHLAPKDEGQRAASHFAALLQDPGWRQFRARSLPGIRFVESHDARERQSRRRRHPRAGIGNLESWWLAEESLLESMKAVGFGGQRCLYANEHRLRYRYCFARSAQVPPSPAGKVELLWPTPTAPAAGEAVARALAADIAYLRRRGVAPSVKGDPQAIPAVTRMLQEARIGVSTSAEYVVLANPEYEGIRRQIGELLTLRACRYAFTSFSMSCFGLAAEPVDPVTGDPLR